MSGFRSGFDGVRVGVVLVVVVCLVGVCLLVPSFALGGVAWWHVNTVSSSSVGGVGGVGSLVVEVSDLGDGLVDGSVSPVVIVDSLPVGVSALHVYGEGGGGAIGQGDVAGLMHCSLVSQRVECVFDGRLLAYERFMIAVTVKTVPGMGGGVNNVSVSGGGAAPVVSRHALALDGVGGVSLFGAENYELTPEEEGGGVDTQAGSHPFQLTTTLTFNTRAPVVRYGFFNNEEFPEVQPVALAKDLRFKLPPGLLGNPTPLPKCSMVFFTRNANGLCPQESVVGVATPIVTNTKSNTHVPLAETVPLYSLEPAVGEPARFGFVPPTGPVILDTSVLTGEGYGVAVTVPDIPDDVGFIGSQVTFWGVPGDPRHDTTRWPCLDQSKPGQPEVSCPSREKPQPFLIMPTSCTGVLQTSVEGDSWAQIGQFTEPFTYTMQNGTGGPLVLDGCNRLGFEPSISVTPDGQQSSTPTGLTVGVHVPQEASLNPTGLAESAVKDTTVALPAGVALNPAAGDGLLACSVEQIALDSPGVSSCPEASKVGTVEVRTPLLANPLVGAAYVATQDTNPFGSLVALYVFVEDPVSGSRVKLAGEVVPDPLTGQLTSTFKNTPQVPFEDFKLHFFGGDRAPLGTPALCGSYTTTGSIAPWSGNPPVTSSSTFNMVSGPNGGPCVSPLVFAPSLTGGSTNIQAGAFTPFTTTMSREDGQQNLQSIQLRMPPGLSGLLTGVKLCSEAQGNAGTCSAESLIGETTVSVGLGGDPFSVKGGRVYITGPYEGAPFGLSIVNPAKAGPYDLEKQTVCDCVVVRARIQVDPITAALTVSTDSTGPHKIPTILDGIPLQIKHVNVTINRPGFAFNPTNCSPMAITGNLLSTEGAIKALSVAFQVTNCATLAFKPIFKVSTTGRTTRQRGASLDVKLAYPKAPFGSQANIAKVKVDLPKQLPSRLTTLQKACPDATFNQNPAACQPASQVGTATATTPLIPVPLTGPAYFVSHGGAKFPELIIVLTGYGVTIQLHGETFINKKGITSSTFRTIPDVPVGTFELKLPQGPNSALAANGNLCTTKLTIPTTFTAANGTTTKQNTPITPTQCPKHTHHPHTKK